MFILSVLFLFLVSFCSCSGLQEGDPCMSELMSKLEIEGMCKRECPFILLTAYKYMGYSLGEEEPKLLECGTQDGVKIVCCPTGVVGTSTVPPVTTSTIGPVPSTVRCVTRTEAPITSTEAAVTPTEAAVTPTEAAVTPTVAAVTPTVAAATPSVAPVTSTDMSEYIR